MNGSRSPGRGPLGRSLPRAGWALALLLCGVGAASAQENPFRIGVCREPATIPAYRLPEPDLLVRRDRPDIVTPCELPRPGYEPRNIWFGQTVVAPELGAAGFYDSNVFASNKDTEDDFVGVVTPRLRVSTGDGKLRLDSELYASVVEYADHSTEDRTEVGAMLGGSYEFNRANLLRSRLRYTHEAEPRTEPDANRDPDDQIPKRDRYEADLQYRYRHNRLTLAPRLTAERLDYVTSGENQKDRWEAQAAFRGSLLVSGNVEAFVQPYARMTDFDLSLDGRDRDFTTMGFLSGASFGGGKWVGELGLGIFYADFDDPAFDDFVGLGARGAFSWSISERTSLKALLSRDVTPTTQPGVPGRVDTRFAASIEQEIRHNLLASAGMEVRATEYRKQQRDLLSVTLSAEAEYLLSRNLSLVFGVGYTDRFADRSDDEYDRFIAQVGTRLRF